MTATVLALMRAPKLPSSGLFGTAGAERRCGRCAREQCEHKQKNAIDFRGRERGLRRYCMTCPRSADHANATHTQTRYARPESLTPATRRARTALVGNFLPILTVMFVG